MQHELRAHAVLAIQKSCDTHLGACNAARQPGRCFPQSHAIHFAFDLPLEAGLDLERLVRQPEIDERQAGRCVAQWFDFGKLAAQCNRVRFQHAAGRYALAGSDAAAVSEPAGAAGAAFGASSVGIERDFSSFIMGEAVVTASVMSTVRCRTTASLNLNACSSSPSVSLSHSMFIST